MNARASVEPNAAAWMQRADELASWALARFFVRTDRFGGYKPDGGRVTRPASATPGAMNRELLVRHFRAAGPGDVVGAHYLTAGEPSLGRVASADIDAHDAEADEPAAWQRNEEYARHLYFNLATEGFRPLLATWGGGSYHLHVLFDSLVPGETLRAFGTWLASDAGEFGFAKPVESFPKQAAVGEGRYGNWLRLVGRHHKRDVWARVFDGSTWLDGAAAVAHVLSLTGDSPDLIPPAPAPRPELRLVHPPESAQPRPRRDDRESVFEAYNRVATLADMIRHVEAVGHKLVRSTTATRAEFRRAGKSKGESFNLKVINGVVYLKNFSTNSGLPDGPGLNPTNARCALLYGDTSTASMKKLAPILERELGWPEKPVITNGKHPKPAALAPAAQAAAPCSAAELSEQSLAEKKVRPVKYLVPGRVPRGKLILWAGRGGSGKSTAARSLVAAVSTGRCAFGLTYPEKDRVVGTVLIFAAEDGAEDTILPGLLAEGADVGRVRLVDGVKRAGRLEDFTLLPEHLELVRAKLEAEPDVRLVILDPIASFVGRARVDDHKATELRLVLDPLSRLAEETGVTVLMIAHLNKTTGAAVDRIAGSAAYRDAVRAAYLVTEDPDDDSRRLLTPIKENLPGFARTAIPFRLLDLDDDQAAEVMAARQFADLGGDDRESARRQLRRVAFEEPVKADPNAATAPAKKNNKTKVERCVEFVRDFLGTLAYPDAELQKAARNAGFTFDNVKDAKAVLRLEGLHSSNRGSFQGVWWVGFGNPDAWNVRTLTLHETAPRSPDSPDSPDSPQTPHT